MKPKKQYYVAETGYFEHKIKVCFSEAAFQEALRDAKITTRHTALDLGVAESHHIQQEGTQNTLIAIVFDLQALSTYDSLEKIGVIVHECVHTVTHVFEHVGEDESKIGDESRAYFTEYLFKQVFAAFATEEDKRERAGERNRKLLEQKNKAAVGAFVQMAEHSDGGTRPHNIPESKGASGRAKNGNRKTKSQTDTGI